LAGRAFIFNLAAFTSEELKDFFDLQTALTWGMLPSIYQFNTDLQRSHYLEAYAHTYLKEEVWAEQFIRELSPFRYFLEKEIDLIVQRSAQETLLIEIKNGNDVQPEQLKPLANLKDEIPNSVAICISNDKNKKRYGDIMVWPWREAIMHYFK
jgi:hypothetical protein